VLLAPLLDVMGFFSELSEALLVSLVLEIEVKFSLRVQIIQLQWKQNVLHHSLHFLSLSLHQLLEHQKNLQLHKSVPVNHHLLAPLLDVMGFFSELSEALLVSLVLGIEVTCRFAALNTPMKFEVLRLELETNNASLNSEKKPITSNNGANNTCI
jgi:hypothetical protein